MHKIVFCDLDGVLNSSHWFGQRGLRPENRDQFDHAIDPTAIDRLNRLCRETGASVVVSSTWRLAYPVEQLCRNFKRVGLTAQVLDKTPDLSHQRIPMVEASCVAWRGSRRGDEIIRWLSDNGPVDSFVILDDDVDMGLLRRLLVQTNPEVGLTDADVERAIALLGQVLE